MAHAIESELNMCVAELAVLQGEVRPYSLGDHYMLKLNELMRILETIPGLVDGIVLKTMIGMLVNSFTRAHYDLNRLPVNIDRGDWEKIFQILNTLDNRLVILTVGAEITGSNLVGVCTALKAAIHQEKKSFMQFNHRESRNTKMHTILSNVGLELARARKGDAGFYSFLGPKAMAKVEEIILLCTL